MKKYLTTVLLAVLMCLVSITGCSAFKALERDVQVVLNVSGEYYGTYTVNIFNNALVPVPDAPEGTTFLGWTAQEDWETMETEDIVVTDNKGLIRYDDVKDYIQGDEQSVTLYAAFVIVPPKDLVVAWYRAQGVSTATGLDEDNISAFTDAMYTYLETKDYTPAEMDIVVRAYDGNVGTSCGQIISDGDVDIMIGWAGNIGSTGGMTFIENNSGVTVGTISRYAARLTSTYLSRLVYTWILNTYGEGYNLPEPDPNEEEVLPEPEPEPEPEPSTLPTYTVEATETFSIKLAWYAKTSTSGIEQTHIDALVEALKADLVKMGFTVANVTVTNKGYDGSVAESCAAVMADDDVDIMIGWGANIGTTGGMSGQYSQNVSGVTVGTISRYVTLLADSDFAKIVFAWIQNVYGTAVDYPACFGWEPPASTNPEPTDPNPTNPEPTDPNPTDPNPTDPEPTDPNPTEPNPSEKVKLVIGWYSKSGTSGLTADIIAQFETALKAYLESQGYKLDEIDLEIRDLGEGDVASVQTAVDQAGDVDIVLGMKAFTPTTEIKDKQENVSMGSKTDRRIHLLSDSDIANLVFEWLKTDDARSTLVIAE